MLVFVLSKVQLTQIYEKRERHKIYLLDIDPSIRWRDILNI